VVSLFKSRSPATIVWLLILSIVVHSHFIAYSPVIKTTGTAGLITDFINKYFVIFSPAVIIIIYHGIIVFQSLRLNHLLADYRMYSRVTYLPAMTYILLTGLFTEWSNLTSALIGNILVIWFYSKIIYLNSSRTPKTSLFNIGLLISISTILYHPLVLLLIPAFFALMILRPFVITEWLILLIGLITPFYFLTSYLYLTNNIASIRSYVPGFKFYVLLLNFSISSITSIIFIIVIFFIGLYYWQQENKRLLIQVRNNWVILIVIMITMLPLPFIYHGENVENLIVCIVSGSPIIAKGFLAAKRKSLPSLMFWILIILSVLKNWQIMK